MNIAGRAACHIAFIMAAMMLWPANNAYAGFFGPSSFKECVSKYTSDVMVKRVTPLMERSCRAKFPKPGEENSSINLAYYDCILERLPEIDSILAVSGVQSACKQAHGPKRKFDAEAAKRAEANKGVVLQVRPAGQYVYLEIDKDGQKVWIAGVSDVSVGDTVRWTKPTLMKNYHSKSLNRTFDEVFFVDRIALIQ